MRVKKKYFDLGRAFHALILASFFSFSILLSCGQNAAYAKDTEDAVTAYYDESLFVNPADTVDYTNTEAEDLLISKTITDEEALSAEDGNMQPGTVSSNEMQQISTAEVMHRVFTLDELYDLDWENMTDHDKTEVIAYTSDEDLSRFLRIADDKTREAVISASYMNEITTVYDYSYDEDGNTLPDPEERQVTYYEYLTENNKTNLLKANWNKTGTSQIVYVKQSTGYYGGAAGGGSTYTIKFSFTSDGGAKNAMTKATLKSVTGNGGAGFAPVAGTYKLEKNENGNLVVAAIPIQLTGLKGYVYTSNTGAPYDSNNSAEMKPGQGITGNEDSYKIYWRFNLWANSSLGDEGNATPAHRLVLSPAKNTVNYNSNGGASTPVSQSFGYFDGVNVSAAIARNPVEFTVTFDGNGGESQSASLKSTRTYTFKNWLRGDNASFAAGQKMGGFGGNGASATLTAQWNDSGQSAVTLPGATRKGYSLTGWSGLGQVRAAGSSFTPPANAAFKAEWKANTYTVSFDTDGGESVSPISAVYDVPVQLPSAVKTGYIFKGWSGAGLSGKQGEAENLSSENGANVPLKAEWEPIKYTIRFDENGGSKVEDVVCCYDSPFTLPASSRDDYAFIGWSDKDGNMISVAQNLSSKDGETVELKAVWSATTVTVSFDTDGGDKINPIKYTIGDSQPLPSAVKKGYTFKGWKDGSGKTYATAQDIVSETGSFTLKAVWEEVKISVPGTEATGLTEQQMKDILTALEAGSVAKVKIDGVEYSFYKNADGTITIKLADIGNAEKLVIPGEITVAGKTWPVTEIEKECFMNNQKLKEVVMGSRITKIGAGAFSGCSNLEKVTFSDGLINIEDKAFFNCSKLKDAVFPKTLQNIGNSAFEGCKSLTKVELNEGLLSIGNRAFYGCSALKKLKICDSLLKIGNAAFSKCTALESVTCSSKAQLLKLGKSVFESDTALLSVVIPGKLTVIPAKAFYGCGKLKKVSGGTSVTKIGNQAFYGCKSLKKITLMSKLHKIGSKAFYGCSRLKKVTIRSKVLTSVGKQAFKKCAKGIKFSVPREKSASYAKILKGKY